MCYSATVSFGISAALLPIGALTLNFALRHDRRFMALAAFPLLFGTQQVIEGFLWLALAVDDADSVRTAALGFLFFAYLWWPMFVPFAANQVEKQPNRKRMFRWFALIGLVFGLSMYLPLPLNPDWLAVRIVQHSILYQPILIYDWVLPRTAVRIFYAVIVSMPLLFSTVRSLRRFGIMVLGSVIISALFFLYTFVSVWCFFAAVLSLYIGVILREENRVEPQRNVSAA
jgi:hypothetical protein